MGWPCFMMALAFASSCSTPSSVAPISIPLVYKTMAEPGDFPSLPACASLSGVEVVDGRAEKTIGKRFLEGNASTVVPVTTSSDVATWARNGALDILRSSGVTIGKPGAPVLRLAIEEIRTNENVVRRSGYDGRIVASGQLIRGGTVLWSDRGNGSAENYGYSGRADNYQETLNHALDRAVLGLLSRPQFRKEICSGQR